MYEIRIHGLGGDGVVKLSELIGKAAISCNKWAHSFPFFGTEIRGSSVKAFTRVDEDPISIKSYIYEPDVLIITNEFELEDESVLEGLSEDSIMIVNTATDQEVLEKNHNCKVVALDATALGQEIIGRPIVNTILLGVLIGATDVVSLESGMEAIKDEFPNKKIVDVNIEAMKRGYEIGRSERK